MLWWLCIVPTTSIHFLPGLWVRTGHMWTPLQTWKAEMKQQQLYVQTAGVMSGAVGAHSPSWHRAEASSSSSCSISLGQQLGPQLPQLLWIVGHVLSFSMASAPALPQGTSILAVRALEAITHRHECKRDTDRFHFVLIGFSSSLPSHTHTPSSCPYCWHCWLQDQ